MNTPLTLDDFRVLAPLIYRQIKEGLRQRIPKRYMNPF